MMDSAQVVQAVDNGLPIKVVYEQMQQSSEGILVAADSPIKSIADVKNVTLGLASDKDLITAVIALESVGATIEGKWILSRSCRPTCRRTSRRSSAASPATHARTSPSSKRRSDGSIPCLLGCTGRSARPARNAARHLCSKASPAFRSATSCRCSRMSTRHALNSPKRAPTTPITGDRWFATWPTSAC